MNTSNEENMEFNINQESLVEGKQMSDFVIKEERREKMQLEALEKELKELAYKPKDIIWANEANDYSLPRSDDYLEFSGSAKKLLLLKKPANLFDAEITLFVAPDVENEVIVEFLKTLLNFFNDWDYTEIRDMINTGCNTGMLVHNLDRASTSITTFTHK